MFLLRYQRDEELRVVILDAYSVAHARMLAAGLEPGTFIEGQMVSRSSVARLPQWAFGRVLTVGDLLSLAIRKKKAPAPSARQRGAGAGPR